MSSAGARIAAVLSLLSVGLIAPPAGAATGAGDQGGGGVAEAGGAMEMMESMGAMMGTDEGVGMMERSEGGDDGGTRPMLEMMRTGEDAADGDGLSFAEVLLTALLTAAAALGLLALFAWRPWAGGRAAIRELDGRLASGQIDVEDYRQRRALLEG